MRAINFNEQWKYKKLNEKTEPKEISIPHDAMLYEERSADAMGGINSAYFLGYDYIYSKEFDMDSDFIDKKVIIEFEGVYHLAEVFINGTKVAYRPYGYSNFYADITDYLLFDKKNVIEVIARNSNQPNSRWYSGAGIYRPVTMWVSEKTYIPLNGVRIKTKSIDPVEVEVEVIVETVGEGEIVIEILDGKNVVNTQKIEVKNNRCNTLFKLKDAKLWNVDTPYLYQCRVSFNDDEVVEDFGIRTISWSNEGFKVNDERVILRGACIHHDLGLLGAACHPEAEERRVKILKENGYNAIRSAHNPCSRALLKACDKLGMFMMDELVDCWYIHKTENDYVNYFGEWWKKDIQAMIEKDYNHPCVIMYSTGNEVSETAQEKGIKLTGELTDYIHQLDGTRPVTCGINIFFNFLSSIGFGVYSDKKAQKEVEKAKKSKNVKKKAVGSEFFNNMAGLLGDNFMKMGATLPPCDWKTKDAFANMDIAGYNYGIFRYKKDLKKYPNRLILGSETFCNDASSFYKLAQKEPRIIGDFVWAGMDYLGEVGIGAWEYSDYADNFDKGLGWISAGSGRIDLTGKPLGEAEYTKVSFGLNSNPVIAVRPVNHTNDKHSPSAWKMTNAMTSWSWNGCDGNDANVEVYTDCYKVTLLINGVKIGTKKIKNCRTMFKTKYQSGVITAISFDENDNEVGRCQLKTANDKTVLSILPEEKGYKKGDLIFVRLAYTDDKNIVKPLERGKIKVTVEGGELIALGNGCPFNLEGYLNEYTDTYFGEALAIIKTHDDKVTIEAEDRRFMNKISIYAGGNYVE